MSTIFVRLLPFGGDQREREKYHYCLSRPLETFTRLRRSKPGDHDRAQLALTSLVDFDIVCKGGDDL